ncbi:MAG: hypothetical protein ACYS99_21690 [Planctomycetota bacterium]|jgi:hypothetical protein
MKPCWFILLLLLLAAPVAAAEESLTVTVTDTPPVDRIVIVPLTPQNVKETKFGGSGTLHLDDETAIPLEVKRKLRKKKDTYKFKAKSPKKFKPKAKVRFQTNGSFTEVLKFKLTLKLEAGKVKQKDPANAAVGPTVPPRPLVPEDILALHDQDLTAATPACQTTGCHENQMTQFAPHKDASGNDVERFHYNKVSSLSSLYFEGRTASELTDKDCTVCHKRVKLLVRSGGNASGGVLHLRRMIDTSFCASCHGPSGLGKALYLK